MGDKKDKKGKKGGGKAGTLFFVLILAVGGAAAVGYFYPDTPVVGDLVGKFVKKASEGQDQSGVYGVTVKKLVLDPQEFNEGETVDMQLVVKVVREDDERQAWDSRDKGTNLRTVGEDELAANWAETPFEIEWQHGDVVIVEVWDRKGFSSTLVARFKSSAADKEFPLKGTKSLAIMDGDREINERKGGTNQIVFEHKRTGDIGAEE